MMTNAIGAFVEDRRFGGVPRFRYSTEGDGFLMQVPDEIRKCVVFVSFVDRGGMPRLAGTAFQILCGTSDPAGSPVYGLLVTAKHVIRGIHRDSKDDKVLLRVNMRDGTTAIHESDVDDWYFHPDDEAVDAAVLTVLFAGKDTEVLAIPAERMIATDEVIHETGISPGDEVFLTGLFSEHFGRKKNLPIVRTGTIALMPEEKVATTFGPADAYLIESRSIGGLSGSPVFVFMGAARLNMGSQKLELFDGGSVFYWLGLVHGHWDEESDQEMQDNVGGREAVNMGIAIVTPATKVMEVVNQKTLVESRAKAWEKMRKDNLPTPDSAPVEDGFSKPDFDSALRKVSRRKKPSESGPAS